MFLVVVSCRRENSLFVCLPIWVFSIVVAVVVCVLSEPWLSFCLSVVSFVEERKVVLMCAHVLLLVNPFQVWVVLFSDIPANLQVFRVLFPPLWLIYVWKFSVLAVQLFAGHFSIWCVVYGAPEDDHLWCEDVWKWKYIYTWNIHSRFTFTLLFELFFLFSTNQSLCYPEFVRLCTCTLSRQ